MIVLTQKDAEDGTIAGSLRSRETGNQATWSPSLVALVLPSGVTMLGKPLEKEP